MSEVEDKIIELLGTLDRKDYVQFIGKLHSDIIKERELELEKKRAESDMNLLDDLVTLCKYWHVERCTHPFYRGCYVLGFCVSSVGCSPHDTDYEIGKSYKIVDKDTIIKEFKNEGVIFTVNHDHYIVNNKGDKFELFREEIVKMINKAATKIREDGKKIA